MADAKRQQELARQMLAKARQDLAAIEQLLRGKQVADEIIGFHAQQAIEKAIKAALIRHGIEYAFTHDLTILFKQASISDLNPPAALEAVATFTPFAVQFRYGLLDEEEEFDRQAASQLSEAFVNWANDIVEKPAEEA